MPLPIRTALAACTVLATTVSAQTVAPKNPATDAPGPRSSNPVPADPLPFLAQAAQGDMAEINMGALAERRGAKPAVRAYGKMMASDHGGHRAKVVALAKAERVTVPPTINAKQQATFNDLSKLNGSAFDTAYKQAMVEAHRENIVKYQAQLNNPDARIAALARETMPTLKKHLAAAEAL